MCAATRLSSNALQRPCRSKDVPFETTAQATGTEGEVVGQERAVEALRFGVGIRRHGYNLFAIGPAGIGKQTLLSQFLEKHAAEATTPNDWCYVHDFANPVRPRVLELPPGVGRRLQGDMERVIQELRVAMRSAFDSEEYRTRRQRFAHRFKERQDRAFAEIQERAKQRDVAVVHTDSGIGIAALHGGAPLEEEEFRALPEGERERLHAEVERFGQEVESFLQKLQDWAREHHESLESLDREMAAAAARRVLDAVRREYSDLPVVLELLAQVELDVVDSADDFLQGTGQGMEAMLQRALRNEQGNDGPSFRRYQINLLVDRSESNGAPVIYEDNPTHANLIGRIEHETQFGALFTNFTLIKPGALHRATGGYLILDALKVLQHPFAWEALKRTLQSGEIRVESLGQALGVVPTVSLEPAPIELGNTKIILTGNRMLYYLLSELDPEFLELFKVIVDFEETMDRRPESEDTYANLIATLVTKEGLRPFDQSAVARVIEHAARSAGDAEKLSVHMRRVVDLLREADFFASEAKVAMASGEHVQQAIDGQLQRSGRVRDHLREAIQRQDILVSTDGDVIGQVNGLAVFQLGEHHFGHPSRITARVRLGKGEVIDIEREVELGGPIHSKGVLILGGFLGARYAHGFPLSLLATLVFEQSYGAVEGDSASLAELCALLSALADVPVRQSIGITGSIDQHGRVQSIGGVNEKIEGFFDVCKERGLTGEHGVVIPKSNVKNLMVRRDVTRAVDEGLFHVHAIDSVDDALDIVTGIPAGIPDEAGHFPEDSINALVEARLHAFAESTRTFATRSMDH